MKKILTSATSAVLYGLPAIVLAQVGGGLPNNGGMDDLNVNLGNQPLIETIGQLINVILGFLGVIAVLIVLLGGFKWMTSGGNEEQIGAAKKLMGAGIIGLIIVVLAYAIATFIINALVQIGQ